MLFWKIFAVIDVLINLGYWHAVATGRERLTRLDVLTVPVGLIGTVGVILYAFALSTIPEQFWHYFLPIFIGIAGWEIAKAACKPEAEIGTFIGVALAIALVGFTSVALYRLGGSTWISFLGM